MIRQLDRPDAKTVMIIALTANAFSEDVSKALRVGMNAHVSKTYSYESLKSGDELIYYRSK